MEKYKIGAEQARTSTKISKIRCHGGVSSADRSLLTFHQVLVLVIGRSEKSVGNSVYNNGQTVTIKTYSAFDQAEDRIC